MFVEDVPEAMHEEPEQVLKWRTRIKADKSIPIVIETELPPMYRVPDKPDGPMSAAERGVLCGTPQSIISEVGPPDHDLAASIDNIVDSLGASDRTSTAVTSGVTVTTGPALSNFSPNKKSTHTQLEMDPGLSGLQTTTTSIDGKTVEPAMMSEKEAADLLAQGTETIFLSDFYHSTQDAIQICLEGEEPKNEVDSKYVVPVSAPKAEKLHGAPARASDVSITMKPYQTIPPLVISQATSSTVLTPAESLAKSPAPLPPTVQLIESRLVQTPQGEPGISPPNNVMPSVPQSMLKLSKPPHTEASRRPSSQSLPVTSSAPTAVSTLPNVSLNTGPVPLLSMPSLISPVSTMPPDIPPGGGPIYGAPIYGTPPWGIP